MPSVTSGRRSAIFAALALACLGYAQAGGSGVVLAGAPAAVVRLAAEGKMPQPPAVYDFIWSGTCVTRSALGCTYSDRQLALDRQLLRSPSERVVTGLGAGIPLLSYVLFHELGHVFDQEWMTDAARDAFMNATGLERDWWSADGGAPPAELFADAYALCSFYGARIARDITTPVGYGWKPTVAEQRLVCGLIQGVGRSRAVRSSS